MSVPTLLVRGKMIVPSGSSKKIREYYNDNIPIDIIIQWLRNRMPEFGSQVAHSPSDRILIVKADTGSGKSTAMPVYLF